MSTPTPEGREPFDRLIGELRPKLHRYCARMTGSTVDADDVVQEAVVKALEAFGAAPIINIEAWIFRIAHNAALDHLRRRARQDAGRAEEDLAMIADPVDAPDSRVAAAAGLRTFMRLPVVQRSTVILMDVLGYTIQEICAVLETSVPAVKAALHRGRTRLRELANEPDEKAAPVLADAERLRLATYVERFNARDFDAIRQMLADDVRLDLVNRVKLAGREKVSTYFTNYSRIQDWVVSPGLVDGHPAILVRDRDDPMGRPIYFILLDWSGERLARIRDFRYARYALDGAEVTSLD